MQIAENADSRECNAGNMLETFWDHVGDVTKM